MTESLHDEVIRVARDLIRLDTTNAREPGLGNETLAAAYLADYLGRNGVEAEVVARTPHRGNLVARIPGTSTVVSTGSTAGSLAFVGHTDVVPCDPRDWTHPPFEAVLDDDGYLWGRGAVDMKNEVAARAVAMAELARTGFRPSDDLWFLAVADEEDGFEDVGMRWLLQERPDIRPTHSINEGGGERLRLSDGREMLCLSVGEKGTYPVQVVATGEAGHASVPTLGRNAVPLLARLLPRLGDGMPEPSLAPEATAMLRVLLGRDEPDLRPRADRGRLAVRRARRHDPGADGADDGADHAVGLQQAQRDAGPGHRRGRHPDPARDDAGRRREPRPRPARRRPALRAGVARGDHRGLELPGRGRRPVGDRGVPGRRR